MLPQTAHYTITRRICSGCWNWRC